MTTVYIVKVMPNGAFGYTAQFDDDQVIFDIQEAVQEGYPVILASDKSEIFAKSILVGTEITDID